MKISANDIDNIVNKIEGLNEMPEARAIVSHLAENPSRIDVPFCDKKLKNKIQKEIKKLGIKNKRSKKYQFIDLFAGIGGFRLAFESSGCQCVFSSEMDEPAKKTYFQNFGVVPYGDIKQIKAEDIPDHDILCAGFPCQPFSIAGVSKKQSMGLETGFKDKTQGTLFFDVKRIIEAKRPKAFMLENVKNLLSHDKKQTWKVIEETLCDLDYSIFYKIVDGKYWVPQHRERIFIVGFDNKRYGKIEDFDIPSHPSRSYKYHTLSTILHDTVDSKYTLGDGTWNCLQRRKIAHAKKGNGFGYTILPEVLEDDTVTATISARYYKDGAEILIPQEGRNPRRLTVDEAMQLQGYNPETYKFPVSDRYAYKQIGNSVVVPAVTETAKAILKKLRKLK